MTKKTVALIQGDLAGISPELMAKLLNEDDAREAANPVAIGAAEVRARAQDHARLKIADVCHAEVDAAVTVSHDQGQQPWCLGRPGNRRGPCPLRYAV